MNLQKKTASKRKVWWVWWLIARRSKKPIWFVSTRKMGKVLHLFIHTHLIQFDWKSLDVFSCSSKTKNNRVFKRNLCVYCVCEVTTYALRVLRAIAIVSIVSVKKTEFNQIRWSNRRCQPCIQCKRLLTRST